MSFPSFFFGYSTERLKSGCEAYIQEVEAEMKCKLEKVGWLPRFYSLPPDIRIASSKEYQEGKVRGKIIKEHLCYKCKVKETLKLIFTGLFFGSRYIHFTLLKGT